ncbi:MAG: AraC family ligand binding domain-containing protein [Sphingomonadales bacterium]|jgi:hypothetical protein
MTNAKIGYVDGELDFRSYRYPVSASMLQLGGEYRNDGRDDTVYGFTCEPCFLYANSNVFRLDANMFFCVPSPLRIQAVSAPTEQHCDSGNAALIIVRHGYRGLFSVGGPIEDRGRLRYIDGCSDTLLICPPRLGEPCLNFLHFPKNISQTMHTHPSIRVGVVARGSGVCKTPSGDFDLRPGMLWLLPEDTPHSFFTYEETMDVIAWHPDSDTGPSDEDHPMVNRTIVDGVAANCIDAIRTVGEIRCE